MKALVFLGPNRLTWEERPEPVAGPNEVVVETRAVGICGSDLHGYTGESTRRTPGNPMGHEATGQVVALGTGVPASWLGRRVAMFLCSPAGSVTSAWAATSIAAESGGSWGTTRWAPWPRG